MFEKMFSDSVCCANNWQNILSNVSVAQISGGSVLAILKQIYIALDNGNF